MLRVAFALLFGWLLTMPLPAQPPQEPAAQMAARILSLLPRRATVSLEFLSGDSVNPGQWSQFRTALQSELQKAGVEITATPQSESQVRVTLSGSVRGRLVAAEVFAGDSRQPQVAIVEWNAPQLGNPKPQITITRSAIWSQAEPILDVLLFDSDSQMLVLGTSKLTSYRLADGKWVSSAMAPIPLSRPAARDPRGRMRMNAEALRIYLPGTTCTGELPPSLKLTCSAGNEAWAMPTDAKVSQVRWVTDRNWMESDSIRGPFYSAAADWVAAMDGRIVDKAGAPVTGSVSWGSELAAVQSPCDGSVVILAAAAGDDETRDLVAAFQIAGAQAGPAAEPLTLPGPVTALWPSDRASQAVLVVHNFKTGEYEASRLGLACAE